MADKFDPYREALVVEWTTIWPESFADLEVDRKRRIAEALHGDPAQCDQLQYIRLPTGFCIQITVTQEDVDRIAL